MLSKEKIRELRKEAKKLDPVVRIGKNGITKGMIEHTSMLLKKHRLVKIKLLKSFSGESATKEIAESLSKDTFSSVVDVIGNTIVLYYAGKKEVRRSA